MPTIGDENPTFADSTPPPIVVENTTGPSPTVNHRKPSSQLSFPADIHKNLLSTKKSTPDPGSWSDVGEEDKTYFPNVMPSSPAPLPPRATRGPPLTIGSADAHVSSDCASLKHFELPTRLQTIPKEGHGVERLGQSPPDSKTPTPRQTEPNSPNEKTEPHALQDGLGGKPGVVMEVHQPRALSPSSPQSPVS